MVQPRLTRIGIAVTVLEPGQEFSALSPVIPSALSRSFSGIFLSKSPDRTAAGNHGKAGKLTVMKMAKAIRQQAATAERVAVNTADAYVANQMRTLAQAFKIQAEIIKKNKKKKRK